MQTHPAAKLFPMLSTAELDALAVDIRSEGLRNPLTTYQGALLDGRNRLAACKIAEVEPSFTEYEGNSPVAFVISANIKRRQLDPSQRACIAVEIEPLFAAEAKARQLRKPINSVVANLRQQNHGKASDQAAEVVSVSPRMVQYAKEIKRDNPETFERIKSGEMTVNEALKEVKAKETEVQRAVKHARETEQEAEREGRRFKVKRGQRWALGHHTLMCGDAYDPTQLAALTNKRKPDAFISDPPYGIDYSPDWKKSDGRPSDFRKVIGDDKPFDPKQFMDFRTVVMFGANYFSDRLPLGGWICWDKRLSEEADKMFGAPFELAWFKSENTAKRSIMVRCLHGGMVNADTEPGKPDAKRYHPTQKPVLVMEEIIAALVKPGEMVLDAFAGSGSTLLACARMGNTCCAMEIDPEYCNIILQRWFDATGEEPQRLH